MFDIIKDSEGLVSNGITTCSGCAMEIIFRKILEVIGDDVIVIIPPGCAATFCGTGDISFIKTAAYQCNLENSASIASGIKNGLEMQGNFHTKVLCFSGDGATLDIGIQALSAVMERNEKIIYVCYDNEAYMNTGIQSSSSTPFRAWTTTTPAGKPVERKNLIGIAAAHDIAYAATASVSDIKDLQGKVKKAMDADGTALLHIQSPCPTGWGYKSGKTIEIARNAVKSGAWLLCEYENGKLTLDKRHTKNRIPVNDYILAQKRFAQVTDDELKDMQAHIDRSIEVISASEQ